MKQPGSSDDPSIIDATEVAQALGRNLDRGLSAAEARQRLAADGPNELRAVPPVPVWRRMVAQFRDPLIYLLLAAIAISLVAWFMEGRTGWPVDALVIASIVLLNAVLGFVEEAKAENGGAGADDRGQLRGRARRPGSARSQRRTGAWRSAGAGRRRFSRRRCAPCARSVAARSGSVTDRGK